MHVAKLWINEDLICQYIYCKQNESYGTPCHIIHHNIEWMNASLIWALFDMTTSWATDQCLASAGTRLAQSLQAITQHYQINAAGVTQKFHKGPMSPFIVWCIGDRIAIEASSLWQGHSARRLSTSSEWSLTWNREGTETHSWCCTVPLFIPSLTMVALSMAHHQTPTYDNWTAFITLDWDWYWEHSAPAQCPACTQRPTRLLWRNVG